MPRVPKVPECLECPGCVVNSRREAALVPERVRAIERLPPTLALEEERCFVRVMSPASELDVRGGRCATGRVRLDVMVFEETSFRAATVAADERTLPTVTSPHFSFDGGWNMPRTRGDLARTTRRRYGGARPSLQCVQQQRQRAIENRRQVTIRYRVARKRLDPGQLVMRVSRDRQLDFEPFGR